MGSHQWRVIGITNKHILQYEKAPGHTRGTIMGPSKIFPRGTPDTTITCSLQQPSTITCCDRFDRNCVNIGNEELPIPKE